MLTPRKCEFSFFHSPNSFCQWKPTSNYPIAFLLDIKKKKASQLINVSFLDKLASFCFAIDRQYLISMSEAVSKCEIWTLDPILIDSILCSLFQISKLPSDKVLGFRILRQMKLACQDVVFCDGGSGGGGGGGGGGEERTTLPPKKLFWRKRRRKRWW